MQAVDALTLMERKWMERYLANGGNATEAAEFAGYAHPNKTGPKLRLKPKIRNAVNEYLRDLSMTAGEVLYRLTEHGRASIEPFIEFETKEDPETGEAVFTGEFWVDLNKAREAGVLHLVKELKQDKHVFTDKDGNTETTYRTMVKLHDAQAALVQLGRYHVLFTDRQDLTSGGQSLMEWLKSYEQRQPQQDQETAETLAAFEHEDATD